MRRETVWAYRYDPLSYRQSIDTRSNSDNNTAALMAEIRRWAGHGPETYQHIAEVQARRVNLDFDLPRSRRYAGKLPLK
jgi:hypothetical protein